MIRSLSEFRFFKSFRIPIESSDDVQVTVEHDDPFSERGVFIDDLQVTDVSITGLGFKSRHKMSIGDTISISVNYRRLRFDVSAIIVRAFSGHIDDPTMSYGAEIEEVEDRDKMSRFLGQLINHFGQERLKDCLRNLALSESYSDLTEGFEMFSLMLSLFKDITNFANQEGFIDSMLEETTRILNAQRAVIFLINTETNQLEASHAVGISKKHLRFDYRKGVAGSVFTTGVSLNIDSSHSKIRFFDKIDKKLGVKTKSVICNPITNREDKIIGAIQVANKRNQDRFTEEDEKVMKLLSLIYSCFFSQYNPVSKKSLIRRFSAPFARNIVWIGKSQHTMDLRRTILKLKDLPTPQTIVGEKGTGKELYARILHSEGARGIHDYEVVDCNSMSAIEMEEKLWGKDDNIGWIEKCSGGSICFRDIDKFPKTLQRRLVETLNRSLLADDKTELDLRCFFTSTEELDELYQNGSIIQEFFDYCNQNVLRMQALRNRKKDIIELVDYFLAKECKAQGFLQKVFSDEIKDALVEYEWPGNVYELKTAIARLVRYNPKNHVITNVDDTILPILKAPINPRVSAEIPYINDHSIDLKDRVLLVEREIMLAEIKRYKGNKSRAAEAMGISREALRKKLIACEKTYEKLQVLEKSKRKKDIDEDTKIFQLPKAA
ncbi:MAG: sigma-54-dependent Fis family transcriptional regulator [Halobacteriovoraceae bacterium]|nr:sigma-54-dependent Fis family transcriptional regulator [Halobacteriovoraceae bacterium]MCB9093671.1 sigma-54-dependent Fis family transcriptional regulator [Halobacteriovoraceae bacterium]